MDSLIDFIEKSGWSISKINSSGRYILSLFTDELINEKLLESKCGSWKKVSLHHQTFGNIILYCPSYVITK